MSHTNEPTTPDAIPSRALILPPDPVKPLFVVLKPSGKCTTSEEAKFAAAHTHEFRMLGEAKTRRENIPDMIHVANHGFHVNAIGDISPFADGTKAVRLSPDDAEKFRDFQDAINTLRQKAWDFIREAAERSPKVTVKDCEKVY